MPRERVLTNPHSITSLLTSESSSFNFPSSNFPHRLFLAIKMWFREVVQEMAGGLFAKWIKH